MPAMANRPISIAAFYRFVELPDYAQLKQPLLEVMRGLEIKGTVLLAHEGINGTVSGTKHNLAEFVAWLRNDPIWNHALFDLEPKYAEAEHPPFARSKVKLKKEIVTLGVPDLNPAETAGTYVAPKDWNQLIKQQDVVTIDTRNDYEVELGRFANAKNPHTKTFREFTDYVKTSLDPAHHKKIAMYCTGGIRCEKSTAYLKSLGFDEVYHLRGGILKYFEEVPAEESLWEGECFVFDERVAVDHKLRPGNYVQCHACRLPLSPKDLNHPHYEVGISCHHCHAEKTPEQKSRYAERQKQIQLAESRSEQHTGDKVAEINLQRRTAKLGAKQSQRRSN